MQGVGQQARYKQGRRSIGRREYIFLLTCWKTCTSIHHQYKPSAMMLKKLDWQSTLEYAIENKMHYTIYLALDKGSLNSLPADVREYLFQSSRRNECLNLQLMLESMRVGQLLAARKVDYLFFKGPFLSLAGYRHVSARKSGDIDILVRSSDFFKAKQILLLAGYCAPKGEEHEVEYLQAQLKRKKGRYLSIDLHYGIPPRYLSLNPSFALDTVKYQLYKNEKFPMPSIESHLLILCVDAYKDTYNSLGRICDIAALIKCQSVQWNILFYKARLQKLTGILTMGLLLAHMQCKVSLPPRVLFQTYMDLGVACTAFKASRSSRIMRRSKSDYSGDTLLAAMYNVIGLERWDHNRLGYYTTRLIKCLKPNRKDLAIISMPSYMRFLLYIIRPCRLFCEYIIYPLSRRRMGHLAGLRSLGFRDPSK